jgi:hypothetical protein
LSMWHQKVENRFIIFTAAGLAAVAAYAVAFKPPSNVLWWSAVSVVALAAPWTYLFRNWRCGSEEEEELPGEPLQTTIEP